MAFTLASSFVLTLVVAFILMIVVELALYFIPGLSLSTLLVAMASMNFGFLPALIISIAGVELAHFIIRKDFMVTVMGIITLIPMCAFAAFMGPGIIAKYSVFGWPLLGAVMGLIKWGVAFPLGFVFGRNMTKRAREIVMEPTINLLLFWKFRFLFAFLF